MTTATINPSKTGPFVISRTFDTTREQLWKAWTERERLMQWFGPKGVKILTAKLDLRPKGSFHYCMVTPDGKPIWGKFVYHDIVRPEKIVWVNSFSDEAGGVTRHPFSGTWPLEMLTTLTLSEKADKTTVTIEWVPIDPSPEELQTFDGGRNSMIQGWTGTFDQLEEYLATGK